MDQDDDSRSDRGSPTKRPKSRSSVARAPLEESAQKIDKEASMAAAMLGNLMESRGPFPYSQSMPSWPSHVNEQGSFESQLFGDDNHREDEIHRGRGCRCGRTKCLKLYCQCFGHGSLCLPECVCTECFNDGKHEVERLKAVKEKRRNNPDHFKGTELELRNMEVRSPGGSVHNVRGCRCRRSKCQKKYCECYSAGLPCAENCICVDCENGNSAATSGQFKGQGQNQQENAAQIVIQNAGVTAARIQQPASEALNPEQTTFANAFKTNIAPAAQTVTIPPLAAPPVQPPAMLGSDTKGKAGSRKRIMTVDVPAAAFSQAEVIPLAAATAVLPKLDQDANTNILPSMNSAAHKTPTSSFDFSAKGLALDNSLFSASSSNGVSRSLADSSLLAGFWTPNSPGSSAFASLPSSALHIFPGWSPREGLRSSARRSAPGCPPPWASIPGPGTGGGEGGTEVSPGPFTRSRSGPLGTLASPGWGLASPANHDVVTSAPVSASAPISARAWGHNSI